ncbi:MAG: hypothetical protein KGI58_01435 [Patescibacteria group bacterium]|nr:hypothetical protein [Patescibacteria group bacterium]
MTGVNWFPIGKKKHVKMINVDGLIQYKELFKSLIGLTILVTPMAQFWYKSTGNTITKNAKPIDDRVYYFFKAKQVVKLLKENNKNATKWESLDPEQPITIISTAFEN